MPPFLITKNSTEKRLKVIYHTKENLFSSDGNSCQATCDKNKHNRLRGSYRGVGVGGGGLWHVS